MDYVSFLVVLLLASCLTVHFFLRIRHAIANKSSKLPPGPYRLPIFGNLFKLGSKPHKSLAELAKTYGPVMSLQLGQLTTVIISSASTAKEVLQKKDTSFCNRTIVDAVNALDHSKYSMVWLPTESSLWRNLRRFSNSHVFSSSRLDASQDLRLKKVEALLSHVESCCRAATAVDIGRVAFSTTLNLLSNTFFSMDLADPSSKTSDNYKNLVWQIMVEAGKPNFADYFPVLKGADPQRIRHRMSIYFGKMMNLFNGIIDRRLAEKNNSAQQTDALDALLRISTDNNNELAVSDIPHLLLDLFVAGSDTTSSTLEWAMAELIHNPDKMKKAQGELAEIIGEKNCLQPVEEAHILRLPYLQAVVKETFRLHPPVPFLIPRRVESDIDLGPFTVPKNSQVLINVWAMGRDTTLWVNPNLFEPERFLGSEIDVKGRDFELIPFGAGRRICPGLPLAIRMLHMMLGSLIHSFDWKLENGIQPKTMDMDDKFGITLAKAQPLCAIPIRC